MTTYALPFDPTGRHSERITVPAGKVLYLSRAPQTSRGTATVTDLLGMNSYVMADGVTLCLTTIPPNDEVALSFMARQRDDVLVILAEVITRRVPDQPCAQGASDGTPEQVVDLVPEREEAAPS